jgi:hypothetical protein
MAVKVAFAIAKVAAAMILYAWFTHYWRAPMAGILAGWCYAFGAAANHMTRHLDFAFSSMLVPLVIVAAARAGATLHPAAFALLGALLGVQFSVNYVHGGVAWWFAAVVVVTVAAGAGRDADSPPAQAGGLRRVAVGVLVAVLVFVGFAGSQIAWFAADLPNHAVPPPILAAPMREHLSLQSPLLLINRLGWLGDWVPSAPAFTGADDGLAQQRVYLGLVSLAVILLGWGPAARDRVLRRWYCACVALFVPPFWMSMGPHTVLDQITGGLGWSAAAAATARHATWTVGGAALLIAAAGWYARRGGRGLRLARSRQGALAVAAACLLGSVSLFDAAAAILSPLRSLRSPGHFFDLAPLPVCLLLGVSAVALDGRLRTRWRWWWVAVAALIALDFWPSTALFEKGTDMGPLRRFAGEVARVPDDATLRVLMPAEFGRRGGDTFLEEASLLAVAAPVGFAWNWLPWQAMAPWPEYVRRSFAAVFAVRPPQASGDAGALAAIARLRYALVRPDRVPVAAGWTLAARNERYALWQGPEVRPHAYGVRHYAVIAGESAGAGHGYAAVIAGHGRNVVALRPTVGGPSHELLDGASAIFAFGPFDVPAVAATRVLRADRTVPPEPFWRHALASIPADPLVPARLERPAPERIDIEIDAGDRPALVVVSESFHPWWRATVDGVAAAIHPAQEVFMSVRLPAGRHRIRFELQRPALVVWADRTTAAMWLAALVVSGVVAVRAVSRHST